MTTISKDRIIYIYTDGACSGNPGPAGVGVILVCETKRKEISKYIGEKTNNIAELMAVRKGLEAVKDRKRPVIVYSDSNYVVGVLSKHWNVNANQELVVEIKDLIKGFTDVTFAKVDGHKGVKENERADTLAKQAVWKGK